MSMRSKIARLFTIKTRFEAFLVTYAIAVGAIERGIHYQQSYPGYGGVILALACLGVPFIAGAKLIDSVKPTVEAKPIVRAPLRSVRYRASRAFSRNRPKDRRTGCG
ncbi:hypothetical protein SH584_04000 [Sphingomonas sp. LY29]|nr:hypothetical protein [Sphingomonas sp. LY29]WRP26604.1 hypothetical protein SH584_04000 [Sphingomonas sp. LY29]